MGFGVGVGVGDAVIAFKDAFEVDCELDEDEVELVHPAAATQRQNAVHIAIIAAYFFIKLTTKRTNVLWLRRAFLQPT